MTMHISIRMFFNVCVCVLLIVQFHLYFNCICHASRNGGRCYLRCDGRMILGNVTSGWLGTHTGDGVSDLRHAYCLWILTVHEGLNNLRLFDVMPTITFTMETDIKTMCGRVCTVFIFKYVCVCVHVRHKMRHLVQWIMILECKL